MDFTAILMIKLLLIIRYKFGYMVPNTTTFRFSSSCLKSSQVGGIPHVGGVTRQHAKGDIGEFSQ